MDKKLKVILENIFEGKKKGNWVVEGMVKALKKIRVKVPLLIRLPGKNVEKENKI